MKSARQKARVGAGGMGREAGFCSKRRGRNHLFMKSVGGLKLNSAARMVAAWVRMWF